MPDMPKPEHQEGSGRRVRYAMMMRREDELDLGEGTFVARKKNGPHLDCGLLNMTRRGRRYGSVMVVRRH